ncbi:MAG: amino acid permease [Neisseriaceae bacterium]|nr:MAG: amino acid permease [Neisseriaceae bacterium]
MQHKKQEQQLARGMKSRHLSMIAIGGTISASFFLGIGDILKQVGAFGTVLGFILGGAVMFLALLSLTEMAVAMPVSGSFQVYATRFISPLAGFMTGWLYLINWVTAAAASLTAASIIVGGWFPVLEIWQWSLIFIVLICALNFFPVKAYGELEFWFAGIKIIAILGFILVGMAVLFGMIPQFGNVIGFKNFYQNGWFPNGYLPFLYGIVVIVCTYQGAELVGIAAGESEDPENNVKRAIRNVGIRILLFFVLSVFIVSLLMPWQQASVSNSPFIAILQQAKIPYIYPIMQLVIVASCLSAVNSAFYACARLLWSMAGSRQAPRLYALTNKNEVPYYGVLVTAAMSGLCLLSKFIGAEKVFILIVSSSGMVGCLIWIMIGWSHIGFRRYLQHEGVNPSTLSFRVRGYPLVPILGIIFNTLVILGMICDDGQRIVVYSGIVLIIFFAIVYKLFYKTA